MTVLAMIRKAKTPKMLIHFISLSEVQNDGRLSRFLIEHKEVKQQRKRIGLSEKAKQRHDEAVEQAYKDKEEEIEEQKWQKFWHGAENKEEED